MLVYMMVSNLCDVGSLLVSCWFQVCLLVVHLTRIVVTAVFLCIYALLVFVGVLPLVRCLSSADSSLVGF